MLTLGDAQVLNVLRSMLRRGVLQNLRNGDKVVGCISGMNVPNLGEKTRSFQDLFKRVVSLCFLKLCAIVKHIGYERN